MLKRMLGGVILTAVLSAIFLTCVITVGLKEALIIWGIAVIVLGLLIVAFILLNG